MSPPHPDAVGSLGDAAIEWAREEMGITLRWWQQLATVKQLEYKLVDGKPVLLWRQVIESTPRRAGKSTRMRVMAMWRVLGAAHFGERQLVMHTGSDLAICLEIIRQAWPWAEDHGMKIRTKNGAEAIEDVLTDSRWLVRGKRSVYGYDVTMGIVDEAWNVAAGVVDDGLEPSLLERIQPQLLITSTAHRKATSLMRRRFHAALAGLEDDKRTLLLWWGLQPGADPADTNNWRLASPHWTEERREFIEDKYNRALRGEADPEFDDLSPMDAFTSQYLNIWPDPEKTRTKDRPFISSVDWNAVADEMDPEYPIACAAVESWYQEGVSVAVAAVRPVGDIIVSVESYPDLASARGALEGIDTILVGKSLSADPAIVDLWPEPRVQTSRSALIDLERMLREGTVRHDGSQTLTNQVLAVRVTDGVEGPNIRSRFRMDAVKAAVWAAKHALAQFEQPAIF